MNLEEKTKEYSLTCNRAVEVAIQETTSTWEEETLDWLTSNDYAVYVKLYGGSLNIYAYIGRDDYLGTQKYEAEQAEEMNEAIQETFDRLGVQVVLNAMIYCGMEDAEQEICWKLD